MQGFLTPLKDHNLKNKNVVVIGCGGSARAVAMGLSSLNIKKVTIIGRNENTLNIFVKSTSNLLSRRGISIESINHTKLNVSPYIEEADLIINATPIGMNDNNTKQKNVPLGHEIWDYLSSKTILYDLIYTPSPTNWLKIGEQKNCFTIDGLDMLVEQGAFSIRLWSGFHDVPVQTMKSSAEKHLMV